VSRLLKTCHDLEISRNMHQHWW